MGRHNPESQTKSRCHVTVDESVHARLRIISAERNITIKALIKEMARLYDVHASSPQPATTP